MRCVRNHLETWDFFLSILQESFVKGATNSTLGKVVCSLRCYLVEKCSCQQASVEAKVGNGELAECPPD